MWKFLASAALLASAAYAAPAQVAWAWTPDTIPWQSAAPNGTRYALLEGVRDQLGVPISYASAIPAGVWDGPHSHSATARVFVARGTLKIGYGPIADKRRASAYPAGSYVIVPAGAVHFDGSDEDTVIIGTAIGPWSTTYLDGSAPASAGTPIKR